MLFSIRIPIKYKFLFVLLFIMFISLGVFFYFAYTTFAEDKKLFVMDLNLTLLKAATSDIKLELKSRLEELQIFVPRVYETNKGGDDPFQGLPPTLADEVLDVSFYKKSPSGAFDVEKMYKNEALLKKKDLLDEDLQLINKKFALPLKQFGESQKTELANRSIRFKRKDKTFELPVLTVLIGGNFINDDKKEMIITVDLVHDFLRTKLSQSEIAEVFLIYKNGTMLAHPSLAYTIDYAAMPYPHPIVQRLSNKQLPRESLELEVEGESYLTNITETGFKDIYAVSQIRKSEAFLALNTLMEKSVLIALAILSMAILVSILFASGLTSNIRKLKSAAEAIGVGQLQVKLNIHSNDELESVAESFEWMSQRLKQLIEESATKARLEEELETARLVQSTILTPPEIQSEDVELSSHYVPASQCGGDFWDAKLQGDYLTVFIGDATGHGAPAAIVTAVAKSCFSTLNTIYDRELLTPDQLLTILNQIVCHSCKGKLLMTMCVVQMNLRSGEAILCNAGHESPFRLHAGSSSQEAGKKKNLPDVLFARGERLGFDPNSVYEPVKFQFDVGDTILLYTDGISEARNPAGEEWGERALKKSLGRGVGMPLGDIKTQIVKDVGEHIQDAVQQDDITFVLVNWKKSKNTVLQPVEPAVEGPKTVLEVGSAQAWQQIPEAEEEIPDEVTPPPLPTEPHALTTETKAEEKYASVEVKPAEAIQEILGEEDESLALETQVPLVSNDDDEGSEAA